MAFSPRVTSSNNNLLSYKIIFIGDSNVGKSSILKRRFNNTFSGSPTPTIGVDFTNIVTEYDNKKIKLHVWDTSGQTYFKFIIKNYLNVTDNVVIMFDLSNRQSFNNLHIWLKELSIRNDYSHIFLVGNKCDLEKHVSDEDIKDFIEHNKKLNLEYLEVSAKQGKNIELLFLKLTQFIYEDNKLLFGDTQSPLLHPENEKKTSCFERFTKCLSKN